MDTSILAQFKDLGMAASVSLAAVGSASVFVSHSSRRSGRPAVVAGLAPGGRTCDGARLLGRSARRGPCPFWPRSATEVPRPSPDGNNWGLCRPLPVLLPATFFVQLRAGRRSGGCAAASRPPPLQRGSVSRLRISSGKCTSQQYRFRLANGCRRSLDT